VVSNLPAHDPPSTPPDGSSTEDWWLCGATGRWSTFFRAGDSGVLQKAASIRSHSRGSCSRQQIAQAGPRFSDMKHTVVQARARRISGVDQEHSRLAPPPARNRQVCKTQVVLPSLGACAGDDQNARAAGQVPPENRIEVSVVRKDSAISDVFRVECRQPQWPAAAGAAPSSSSRAGNPAGRRVPQAVRRE